LSTMDHEEAKVKREAEYNESLASPDKGAVASSLSEAEMEAARRLFMTAGRVTMSPTDFHEFDGDVRLEAVLTIMMEFHADVYLRVLATVIYKRFGHMVDLRPLLGPPLPGDVKTIASSEPRWRPHDPALTTLVPPGMVAGGSAWGAATFGDPPPGSVLTGVSTLSSSMPTVASAPKKWSPYIYFREINTIDRTQPGVFRITGDFLNRKGLGDLVDGTRVFVGIKSEPKMYAVISRMRGAMLVWPKKVKDQGKAEDKNGYILECLSHEIGEVEEYLVARGVPVFDL